MKIEEIIATLEDNQRDIAAYLHALALKHEDPGEKMLLEELEGQLLEYAEDLKELQNIIKPRTDD